MKEGTLPPLPLVLFKFSPREISTSSDLLPSLFSLSSSLSLVSLAADTEGKKVRRQRSGEDSVALSLCTSVYICIYTLVLSSFQTFLVSMTFLLLLLLLFFLSLDLFVFSSNLACCLELYGLSIKQGLDCSMNIRCRSIKQGLDCSMNIRCRSISIHCPS